MFVEGAFGTAVGTPRTLKEHAEMTGCRFLRGAYVG